MGNILAWASGVINWELVILVMRGVLVTNFFPSGVL